MFSGNLYGLKECGIVFELFLCVVDEFKCIKACVKRSFSFKDVALVDCFYLYIVVVVDDLCEYVYKNVVLLLFNIEFCVEVIGDGDLNFALVNFTFVGKYNIRETSSRYNKWVDDV